VDASWLRVLPLVLVPTSLLGRSEGAVGG